VGGDGGEHQECHGGKAFHWVSPQSGVLPIEDKIMRRHLQLHILHYHLPP
jgi:hypothetical protein